MYPLEDRRAAFVSTLRSTPKSKSRKSHADLRRNSFAKDTSDLVKTFPDLTLVQASAKWLGSRIHTIPSIPAASTIWPVLLESQCPRAGFTDAAKQQAEVCN